MNCPCSGGGKRSFWGCLQSQVERQRCCNQDHRKWIREKSLHCWGKCLWWTFYSVHKLSQDMISQFNLSHSISVSLAVTLLPEMLNGENMDEMLHWGFSLSSAPAAFTREPPQHCEVVWLLPHSSKLTGMISHLMLYYTDTVMIHIACN